MTINLIWPRPEIYNSVPPFEWYFQWGGVLFVAAVTIGGTLLYRLKIRHQTGVLAEHAAAVAAHPSSGAAGQPQPVREGGGAEEGLDPIEDGLEPQRVS
jgi:hypothetical protein